MQSRARALESSNRELRQKQSSFTELHPRSRAPQTRVHDKHVRLRDHLQNSQAFQPSGPSVLVGPKEKIECFITNFGWLVSTKLCATFVNRRTQRLIFPALTNQMRLSKRQNFATNSCEQPTRTTRREDKLWADKEYAI